MKYELLVVASLFIVKSSAADYQQLPGHFGGFGSDGSTITVADDFQFTQDTLLSDVIWWGGYFNPPPGADNFTVRLFSDSGGHPASLLREFDFGVVNAVATGQFVNAPNLYPEFQYSATFATPFLAQAGTRYWLGIVNPPADIWLWEASASSLNPGVQRSFDGGPWEPYFDNTSFELVAVPEPSAALFLATAATWLILSLVKKRTLKRLATGAGPLLPNVERR